MYPGRRSFLLLTSSRAISAAGMQACPPCHPPSPPMGKMPPMWSTLPSFSMIEDAQTEQWSNAAPIHSGQYCNKGIAFKDLFLVLGTLWDLESDRTNADWRSETPYILFENQYYFRRVYWRNKTTKEDFTLARPTQGLPQSQGSSDWSHISVLTGQNKTVNWLLALIRNNLFGDTEWMPVETINSHVLVD